MKKKLHEIIKYMRANSPNVKLIFAATLPTPEGNELKFNPVAQKVMTENDVPF